MVDTFTLPSSRRGLDAAELSNVIFGSYFDANVSGGSSRRDSFDSLATPMATPTGSITTPADAVSPAITIAARNGQLAATRQLLEDGAGIDLDLPSQHSPLAEAARRGHVKVTQLLLAERARRGLWGEDRHLRDGSILREAEERGDIEMVQLLTMSHEDLLSMEDIDRQREVGASRRDSAIDF